MTRTGGIGDGSTNAFVHAISSQSENDEQGKHQRNLIEERINN